MSMWINVERGEWKAGFLKNVGIERMEPNVVYNIPDELDVYMEDHRRIGLHRVVDIQAKPSKMRSKILTESKPKKTRKKKKKK